LEEFGLMYFHESKEVGAVEVDVDIEGYINNVLVQLILPLRQYPSQYKHLHDFVCIGTSTSKDLIGRICSEAFHVSRIIL
jgi:hypothetical protein